MSFSDITLLEKRLDRLLRFAVTFAGIVYRSCTPEYANESDLLNGEGSRLFGGRWNPRGVPMVYTSLTPETALAETLAHYRYHAIPEEDAMPRVFVAISAKIGTILDLRDGSIRRRLRVAGSRMRAVDWRREVTRGFEPITQQIGRAAYSMNWQGLLVPSVADLHGTNLLIFPDRLTENDELRVLNVDRLPTS